jgi:RNA polymerase sigma-70 factor (ECF subfamily)
LERARSLTELEHAAAAAAGFHVPMPEGYEEQLVERLKRRDELAFNELVRAYDKRVFRLVLRMLNDRAEAEDVTQEVFITVFKAIDSFRGDSKLSTWMFRVATNHCKNRIKYLDRRARGKKSELDELSEHGAVESASMSSSAQVARPDQQAEANQIETIVRAAIAELDEDQRELVILRDVENLSYEEIQEITGLPEGTVKSRLHRARLQLAKAVRKADGSLAEGEGVKKKKP